MSNTGINQAKAYVKTRTTTTTTEPVLIKQKNGSLSG